MSHNKTAVFAIYPNDSAAERAVRALKTVGFSDDDVSVLFSSPNTTKEFAHEKHTKAPEGATTGAGAGATLGGALGWLAGIGAVAIPGVGPFIAAGPIMGLLAGASLGGAVGSLTGALIGLGIPEYEAKRYEGRLHKGGVLLSVHTDTSAEAEEAKQILTHTGGEDIGTKGEASSDANKKPSKVIAPIITDRPSSDRPSGVASGVANTAPTKEAGFGVRK